MKQIPLMLVLLVLGFLCLGCGDAAPTELAAPVKTLRPTFTPMPTATNTPLPTATPLPANTPLPTATPLPPTDTPELPPETPTSSPTPEPPTPTTALPTVTRQPVRPTPVPPTPTPTPQHVVGSHGVSGLVIARDKTTFAVGEKAFFTYEALNHTEDPISFELLGIKASNGQFNTSWVNPDFILPDVPFKHDDGMAFSSPGTYKVALAICFARCSESDADWEEFWAGAATITVK